MGEELCACVKLKQGETSSAEEIKAFCKGQVNELLDVFNACLTYKLVPFFFCSLFYSSYQKCLKMLEREIYRSVTNQAIKYRSKHRF